MAQLKARVKYKDQLTEQEVRSRLLQSLPEGSLAYLIQRSNSGQQRVYSILLINGEEAINLDVEVAFLLDRSLHERGGVIVPNFGSDPGRTLIQDVGLRLHGDATTIRYKHLT
jgi:hypothetical protein